MRKAAMGLAFAASLILMGSGGSPASASPGAAGTECPAGTAAITGLSFTVNGQPTAMSGLVIGGVMSGNTVTASFTVAPGCTAVPFNFSAYDAVAAIANAGNVSQQMLRSNATGTFGAGAHTLTVAVPSCFFQIDLYRGPLVTQWNLPNLLSFFANGSFNSGSSLRQMLGNATGGTVACQTASVREAPPIPPTTPPTITVTIPAITVTMPTIPVVLGVQTAPSAPAAPAAVAAPVAVQVVTTVPAPNIAGLPSTSTAPRSDLTGILGLAFIAVGALLLRRSAIRSR